MMNISSSRILRMISFSHDNSPLQGECWVVVLTLINTDPLTR